MTPSYKMSFACFDCRKSFKREVDIYNVTLELTCPECGNTSYNFGRHFKPPKKSDKEQWNKVRYLKEHGFWFQKIRPDENSVDSIPYPDTLDEAKEFVNKYKDFALKLN
jgi:DNA-directed RNA polymerase subunit RPC12/RpoP